MGAIYPLLDLYIGPFLPQFVNDLITSFAIRLCSTELTQYTVCQPVIDLIVGIGGDKELIVSR